MSKSAVDDFDTKKYKYKPVDLKVPSRLLYPDGSFEEFYGRISLGGCKAVTVKDLGPEDRVRMAFLKKDESYFEVEGTVIRIKKVKVSFDDETYKVDSRYYECDDCGWKGYCRLGEDSKVYWETDRYEDDQDPFYYLEYITRHKEGNVQSYDHFCPNCRGELPAQDQELTRLGIKFDELSVDQEEEISKIIKYNLLLKRMVSKKDMEPGYLLTELSQFYRDKVHVYNDLLKDFSKCNMTLDSKKELDIHERLKVNVGLEGGEILATIDAEVIHKLKVDKNFRYGLHLIFKDNEDRINTENKIRELTEKDWLKFIEAKKKARQTKSFWTAFSFSSGSLSLGVLIGVLIGATTFSFMSQKEFQSDNQTNLAENQKIESDQKNEK